MFYNSDLLLHIPGLSCLWWLLLAMLLPLLLGLLLGYWLWYQYKKLADQLAVERDNYHDKFTNMEKEYASLKYKYDELQKDNNALRASLHSAEADLAILKTKLSKALEGAGEAAERGIQLAASETAEYDFAALFPETNLQIIEGIGPGVEKVLKEAGIGAWAALAAKAPAQIKAILKKAGPGYEMQDPKSWPEQAKLADRGEWAELIEYQKFLDAGREDKGDFETPSKLLVMAEKMTGKGETAARGVSPGLAGIFTEDNLQIIEGVGPKLEEVLKQAGFGNWGAIASATPEQISEALVNADPKYRIHDPETWPRQAKLAGEGKWDELIEYQKFLDTGKEDQGGFDSPSKVEKLSMKILGFTNARPDDLKIVEGIGPKIEQLLKDAGISNWTDLAGASPEKLREILDAAGDKYRLAVPDTWPKQARMAAQSRWKELRDYQDLLDGGKDTNA